jgi:hypothetical protein
MQKLFSPKKTNFITALSVLSTFATSQFAIAQTAIAAPEFRDHPFFQFDSGDSLTADIALADIDSDGDLDALAANGRHWAQQDIVFLNSGSGRFLEARRLGDLLSASYAHLVADFDRDGDQDIVTLGDQIPATMHINNGSGTFETADRLANTEGHVRSGVVFDANNDGIFDIAIATRRGADVVLLGNGEGGFPQIITLPGDGKGSTGFATADFNSDGFTDLIISRRDGSESVIMENMGGLMFKARTLPGSLGDHRKTVVGDFDNDTSTDVLLVSTDGDHKLYLNIQLNKITPPIHVDRSGHATQSMAAADLNADGHLDLIEGNDGLNYILINQGDGTFLPYNFSGESQDTYGVSVGDMNGDGKADIVIANSESANQVFIQR